MRVSKDQGAGIVRKLDSLHRLVIPQEYCRLLKWEAGTPVEVTHIGKNLILSCNEKSCYICGRRNNLVTVKSVSICRDCVAALTLAAE